MVLLQSGHPKFRPFLLLILKGKTSKRCLVGSVHLDGGFLECCWTSYLIILSDIANSGLLFKYRLKVSKSLLIFLYTMQNYSNCGRMTHGCVPQMMVLWLANNMFIMRTCCSVHISIYFVTVPLLMIGLFPILSKSNFWTKSSVNFSMQKWF